MRRILSMKFGDFMAQMVVDGTLVRLALWDTKGQDYYDELRPLVYPHGFYHFGHLTVPL